MKRLFLFVGSLLFVILMAACSSESKSDLAGSGAPKDNAMVDHVESEESANQGRSEFDGGNGNSEKLNDSSDRDQADKLDRKIIYTANLHIEVKDYKRAYDEITVQAANYGGYIVESTMSDTSEQDAIYGEMTVRIPQEHFREFLDRAEKAGSRVITSSVRGQDVTEEYIDLNSRLKSKRIVESRLLSFLEKAEKTEDLLAISKDLAEVQEEIESIIGRMNYLENRSDLATVTIYMEEKNVEISALGDGDLNTWEQTKEQFKRSVNFLIHGFSALFVFLVGNLPVIVLLGIAAFIIYFIIKKRLNNQKDGPGGQEP